MDENYEGGRGAASDAGHVADAVSPLGDAAAGARVAGQFKLEVPQSGSRDVLISFANGFSEARPATVWVDGHAEQVVDFPATGAWSVFKALAVRLDLKAGLRDVTITALNNAGPEVSGVTLGADGAPESAGGRADPVSTLVNSLTAAAALALLPGLAVTKARAAAAETADDAAPTDVPSNSDTPIENATELNETGTQSPPAPESDASQDASQQQDAEGSNTANSGAGNAESTNTNATTGPVDMASGGSTSQPDIEIAPVTSEAQALDDEAVAEDDTDVSQDADEVVAPQALALDMPGRIQAEDAGVVRGSAGTTTPAIVTEATAEGDNVGYAGAAEGDAYVDFNTVLSGEFIEFTFDVASDGYYDLGVGYALQDGNRSMRLDVKHGEGVYELFDRMFDLPATGSFGTYGEADARVFLSAGTNTVRLTSNGFSGPNIDYLDVRSASADTIVIQAEDLLDEPAAGAASSGNRQITLKYLTEQSATETFRVGAEGDAYLDWGSAAGTVDVPVTAGVAGTYSISITYVNGSANARPLTLSNVDSGDTVGTFAFAPTVKPSAYPTDYQDIPTRLRPADTSDAGTDPDATTWEGWTRESLSQTVTLAAGTNLLRLSGTNGPNIDKIELVLVEAEEPPPVKTNEAPIALDGVGATSEDNAVTIDVAELIDDADGDSLTVTASAPAVQGSVSVSGTVITFAPAADFNGDATISYTVSDGEASDSATISVSVAAVNDAPTLSGTLADSELPATGGSVDVSALIANDVDGDVPTIEIRLAGGDALPAGITLSGGAILVGEDVPAGTYQIEIIATDGTLVSSPVALTLVKEDGMADPEFESFVLQAEDADVVDLSNSGTLTDSDTQARDPGNPEATATGKSLDADNLRPGHSGDGYVDFGGSAAAVGDNLTFNVNVAEAGEYSLHFRYANGGGANRPLTLSVNDGVGTELPFASLGSGDSFWTQWTVQNAVVQLAAGSNSVMLTLPNSAVLQGPNIDALAVTATGDTPSFFMPVITSETTVSIAENTNAVMTISADDGDAGDSLTYSLTATGADNALFAIDASSGDLQFLSAPDFETPADANGDNIYDVEIAVTDGSATVTQAVAVTVTDVPETGFGQILLQAEAGDLNVLDIDGNTNDTTIRNARNQETTAGLTNGLRPDFGGSGYVDFGDTAGDAVNFTFSVAQDGTYDVQIRYATNTARPLVLNIDGQSQTVPFPATGTNSAGPGEGFNNWAVQTVTIPLTAGAHTMSLAIPPGANTGPNVDAIAITETGVAANFTSPNALPEVADDSFAVTEGTTIVGTVSASDAENDRVTFALTNNGATDNALFAIDADTGAISFITAPDFEAPAGLSADNSYTIEVEASDGAQASLKTITVTVENDPADDLANAAPVIETTTLFADENQTSAGTVAATDANGDVLTYALTSNDATDNALFTIDSASGALSFIAAPDYETNTSFTVEVAVSDGTVETVQQIAVNVNDIAEGGPLAVDFSGAITSYAGQDTPFAAPGFAVDNAALSLTDNVWKRAALPESYTVTGSSTLVFDVAMTGASEIVAVGFDFDNDAFDGDRSIYQLAGTQTFAQFNDLRGQGTDNGDGTFRFEIELGSLHAGKVLTSLVFINDDDVSSDGIGTATFSNVSFIEEAAGNSAPVVVGGGIADMTVDEGRTLEVDIPVLDPDGDALSYALVVRDASGAIVEGALGLSIEGGNLVGMLSNQSAGSYTIEITATDPSGADATTSFALTVDEVNEAPVSNAPAFEPYFGEVGAFIDSISLASITDNFSDPDGDALTFTVEGLPEGLSLAEGVIQGAPEVSGTFTVIVRGTDPDGLSDTVELTFTIGGEEVGDTTSIEAEDFTGLGSGTAFFATGATAASGNRLIRVNDGTSGTVSTDLSANGLSAGYYTVTAYVFDETDGASTFSLSVGDTVLSADGNETVVLNDAGPGTFVNSGSARGNAANAGNLKAIAFETVVYVDEGTLATISGQANGGEGLRIDRLEFTRADEPVNAAPTSVTLTGAVEENAAGAVVGVLTAVDPEGDTVSLTTDDERFEIVEADGVTQLMLKPGVSLDHETDDGETVTISATDAEGGTASFEVAIDVIDLNEAPGLVGGAALDDASIATGTGGSIDLSGLGATDPDAGDVVSYGVRATNGTLPDGISVSGNTLVVAAGVAAGTYALEVLASDGTLESGAVALSLTVTEGTAEPVPFDPVTIQAEVGNIVSNDNGANETITTVRDPDNIESNEDLETGLRPDFTGTGYIDFGDTAGDTVSYTITVAEAGNYDFAIRYASNSARPLDFAVNGGTPVNLPFVATDPDGSGPEEGFDHWLTQLVSADLVAGENTFSLAIPAGANTGPNIDAITVTRPDAGVPDTSADADDIPLFLSGPDAPLGGANKDSINFSLAGIDTDIVTVEISFDGGVTRTEVFPDADGDLTVDGSALTTGTYTATAYVTDDAGNSASVSMQIEVDDSTSVPFTLEIEGETFTPIDTTGTGNQITQARVPGNIESTPPVRDTNADGLWDGFEGAGYLDMGAQIGDAASFTFDAPEAGTYTFEFRYSNGGGAPNGDRPMTLSVTGGATETVSFPGTGVNGWDNWGVAIIEVDLAAGSQTITLANTVANGPNIDNVTISKDVDGPVDPVDPREQIRFEEVVKVNFEPAPGQTSNGLPGGYQTPTGYLADTGAAYGDRGNGFSYGWVSETSVADGTENGTTPTAQPANAHWYKNTVTGASDLQKTYAHFEFPGAGAGGSRAWEMALENGTYQVTMSIGDTAGAFDSTYTVNLEGESVQPSWVPANPVDGSTDGEGFRSTLVTRTVTVTDGKLTLDSIGGVNTEIQYLEVERIPDLTPGDGRSADLDFSMFAAPVADSLDGQVSIQIGANGELPTGIDPNSMLVVGVNIQADGNRGPNIAHVEGIKLVETLTGIEAPIDVQISGGADSMTIRPLQQLKENTSYTLKVEDVLDLGSISDPDGALRQFQDLTTTFVTGEAQEEVAREVAFATDVILNGFDDGAGGFTSIEFGPDGRLYVATITGEIHRWNVNADGTVDKASQETLSLDYLETPGGDRRGIVGITFDPSDPETIWISDNAPIPRESKAFDTPEFSGRVSKITLGEGGSFEGATADAYITGLPRSGGDHLTNSLEFRPNPDAGASDEPDYLLYLSQGSNSAAGAADGAWGNRPERLLNAAILEIDPTRTGTTDVRTEPVGPDDAPTTTFPASQFNADGTYPGMYNPYAEDAVLKIYATGVRNAYDLVWHSNGHLYVPTNGTASGGRTPNDPTQPGLDTVINNSPKQYDYFFTVDEDGYYGHPNVLRDHYILNGGNPTSGLDPNEVVGGNDGNNSTDGYQTGVQPEEDYDVDGVYNLGYNRSPNGAIEYTGNAFGSNLKGAVLFAQFSTGDNVRMIRVDAEGNIVGDDVLRRPDGSVIDDYIDPLDIIENPVTGQLYLMTLNRGTGASQVVLLTPAPGGVTEDLTADEGNNLAIVAFDASDPSQAIFQVNGLDDDITAIRVAFNGGPETAVTLDAQNRFTVDLGALEGETTVSLRVTDDDLNEKTVSAVFTPGEEPVEPGEFVSLVTIQAEDKTPADGTAVTVATGSTAEIQIRDSGNVEPNGTGAGYVNGLRPGAFGIDGNTVNTDGTPGGYADFGLTNADFMTFTFDVPADNAGNAVLRFRYSNGGAVDRPLQVEVNGSIVTLQSFTPTAAGPDSDGWTLWSTVDVPASLLGGQNTVTLRSVDNTGPNIDQLEVLVPPASEEVPNDGEMVVGGVTYLVYEAENAESTGAPAVISEDRNQSGAFVDFLGPDTETVTWTVEVDEAGTYGIDILYALGSNKTARPMSLALNGQVVETLAFVPNSDTAEAVWGPQTTTLDLVAGLNTITVAAPGGVGPNLDYLRVTKEPLSVFEPDFADIDGSGRIELEATDGSANTVNGSIVEFYFTLADDGIYKLDAAANAGATNGQGLTWFLNGVAIDESDFPGIGEAGEESVYIELEAGTEYQLRIVSDAPGANGIDYLDIAPAPGNANADIAIDSLDPAYLENRLHFSFLENPDAVDPDAVDRDFKDSGTVRLTNSGTEPLEFIDYELDGPFVLADPDVLDGLTLAAGASIDVTVLFDRSQYTPPTSNIDGTSTVFQGALEIVTNDADSPVVTVDLAGFWQARDEGGQEPNVNEVWKIFGFGNVIEGLRLTGGGENSTLSTNDVFAKTDDTEVLSPYWKLANGVTEAKITHIAAFHGTGGATMHIHNPGNKNQNVQLWNHEGNDNQRLLPNMGNDTTFATTTIGNGRIPDAWVGEEVFGISVAGLSTDPRLNPRGDVIVEGAQQGHTVKMFQALDADGNVIPNVYLGIMDYTGINYDYNDNMFVIEGVTPVGFGQVLDVEGLDDAAADDRLVFTSIDTPANGQQNFRDEATFTITNDGFAALNISGITIGDPEAFEIVGTIPTSIAAGGSADVTVRFIGSHAGTGAGADLFNSTLTITSDDLVNGQKVIQLAGLAQEFSENGSEPTVAQIVEAFGYSTDMAQGELAGGGLVETIGDEVLMPYMERLDGSRPVEVIQLAAFLQQNNVARLGFHGLSSDAVTNLFAQDDQEYQTVLPSSLVAGNGAGSGVARGTINQDGPFGLFISVDGRPTYASWSDPEANRIDPDFGQLVGDEQGHLIRFFQALDAEGNAIEGTYIAIQDYPGAGNYDYNDHMFVIKNVQPHELTASEDGDGNAVNDALEDDQDNDGIIDFFDPDNTPEEPEEPEEPGEPGGENRGDFVLGVNFGGGAIANDPVLGVPLVGQNDSRVVLSGSINPGAGTDSPSNANGAGATPGSAFTTYEDGSNWTAAISVPNGTYVVVLHTQETYWNAPGMRQFDASINGQQVINNLDPFASAGGDEPIAVEAVVTVTNGVISINMSADIDNAPLNAVTIYEYVEAPAQQPVNGSAFLVDADGVTIDALDYDEGGQDIAYNDAAGLQGGNNGGRAGSDVEATSSGDIGWIGSGEWLEYTIDVASAGSYNLGLLLANAAGAGRVARVDFYDLDDDTPYATTGNIANPQLPNWSTFANRTANGIQLEAGEQIMRVTFDGGSQDFRSVSLTPNITQTPFGGTAPGFTNGLLTVDATNFDNGGQGIAYNDDAGLDGGNTGLRPGRDVEFVGAENDIGHVEPGEWVEYTINVATAGTYSFSVNAKTPVSGATVTLSQAGGATLGVVNLADGHAGGSSFGSAAFAQSAAIPVTLAAGVQTLRLAFDGPLASNGYVMDLKSFTLQAQNLQTPFGGSAPVLDGDGLTIDAVDYDNGGQGIAYNDAAGLQGGTNGGRAGSAVEVTGSGDVGWIGSGEWLEYTISVEDAGSYALNLSMALGDAGGPNRSVTVSFTNGGETETVTLGTPRTGTWNSFQSTETVDVDLDAGTTVVRLTFNGGSQDIRSFSLEPVQEAQQSQSQGQMASMASFADLVFPSEPPVMPEAADLVHPDMDGTPDLAPVFGYDLNA